MLNLLCNNNLWNCAGNSWVITKTGQTKKYSTRLVKVKAHKNLNRLQSSRTICVITGADTITHTRSLRIWPILPLKFVKHKVCWTPKYLWIKISQKWQKLTRKNLRKIFTNTWYKKENQLYIHTQLCHCKTLFKAK